MTNHAQAEASHQPDKQMILEELKLVCCCEADAETEEGAQECSDLLVVGSVSLEHCCHIGRYLLASPIHTDPQGMRSPFVLCFSQVQSLSLRGRPSLSQTRYSLE